MVAVIGKAQASAAPAVRTGPRLSRARAAAEAGAGRRGRGPGRPPPSQRRRHDRFGCFVMLPNSHSPDFLQS